MAVRRALPAGDIRGAALVALRVSTNRRQPAHVEGEQRKKHDEDAPAQARSIPRDRASGESG